MWERVKGTGIDLLTEGIRLVQAAGEQLLQQIADRRLRVPGFIHGALEHLIGHSKPAPPEEIEFVCRPAGTDRVACEPVDRQPAPSAAGDPVPKVVRRRAAPRRPPKSPGAATAPKRPRRKTSKPSVPPSADGIDAS
jgi:hypothetical protein